MDIFSIYIATFFIVFLIMPVTYFTLRFVLWFLVEYCGCSRTYRRDRERDRNHGEQNTRRRVSNWGLFYDRQGNIFTISDETTANTANNRYPDFFYLDPTGEEAARIRAQLEKDDKDLPSYEDVIRMTSSPTTTPGTTFSASISSNATNINTNHLEPPPTSTSSSISLSPPDSTEPPPPVPPYSEIDPNAATTSNNISSETASTSRGASVTIPIENSVSRTSV